VVRHSIKTGGAYQWFIWPMWGFFQNRGYYQFTNGFTTDIGANDCTGSSTTKKPLTVRPGARSLHWEKALCACPIEYWEGNNLTLRIRPEAFRAVMYRHWDSIQHDCHHALLFKKNKHTLNVNTLLTSVSYQ
jgi:hypothetical protein